jgi:hypothetical protein
LPCVVYFFQVFWYCNTWIAMEIILSCCLSYQNALYLFTYFVLLEIKSGSHAYKLCAVYCQPLKCTLKNSSLTFSDVTISLLSPSLANYFVSEAISYHFYWLFYYEDLKYNNNGDLNGSRENANLYKNEEEINCVVYILKSIIKQNNTFDSTFY